MKDDTRNTIDSNADAVQKSQLAVRQKSPGKILLRALLILAAAVCLFFLGVRVYFRRGLGSYYRASRKAFEIPGIPDGYIAQGICYDAETGFFFLTGYQNDDKASPIYVLQRDPSSAGNPAGAEAKTVRMEDADGNPSHNHAGGISVYGDYVYVAGGHDHCVYVYSKREILDAADGAGVSCLGKFVTEASEEDYLGIAFTTIHDGKIYLGEFYREQNYPTLPSHKLTTAAGDYNQALVLSYALDESAPLGIAPEPLEAYSVTDLAQGMCFGDGILYLSTSYGVPAAHIYLYDEKKLKQNGTITVLGTELPLYELDSASLAGDWKIAPMSEEIEIVGDELYVLTESASNKYIFGKFTSAKYCYATRLDWGE